MPDFSHLHVHTQYSLLDGQASLKAIMKKAVADKMKAVAITDHGNMFGVFNFVNEATKAGIKPIVGCEFYMVADRHRKVFTKDSPDVRCHQLMLAKNQEGYKNLSRLCSLGYIEGMYSKWPRIDKELVLKYHKGLIATTCCLGAEVPQAILKFGEEEAEKAFKWWLDIFGEDYYVELQRHKLPEQDKVNAVLLKFAAKYNVKIICSNDSHYVDREDFNAHDILLCINTGEQKSTPIWKEEGSSPRGYRFGFSNDEFYFKSQAEMLSVFHDLPEALDNTAEIVDKVTPPVIKHDIMLPYFPLPGEFAEPDDFLRHLTYEGARSRYSEITDNIRERLDFELSIIKKMGFAGYFLIVQDLINQSKKRKVWVGPGRGSAAGSAVAYCIGITNIDPIRYSLLFERFLNPERVTMPDIDIDFDDENRDKVINYVVEKYGQEQVAQIITYGTMAAKSAIKDVGRVMNMPLADANYLTGLVPDAPGTTLAQAYEQSAELKEIREAKTEERGMVLGYAEKLEGSIRNTGIHASAYVIAPADLIDLVPLCVSKDSILRVSQFDGKLIEDAGMLKMDFLGLKTLTIIRDAVEMVREHRKIELDMDKIPEDDGPTFALYQRGDTVGTFQFESPGMRQYLKDLKPTNIEDLIAMNALYRPGPMDFIPSFINRKQGREAVAYPHPLLEGILKHTYGIMVYQEQIMQTAQILAGYSLGGADLLRRAMGKKDKEKMAREREKFIAGAEKIHNIPKDKASDVFDVMERFAQYGFNRSHAAAYSVLAYQTAYLKANFPAEYMASVLTHSMGNIEKITFFMEECRNMNLQVLGPDVNESQQKFSVNKSGAIRFGLGAIKGSGENAVESIIAEREANGPFKSVFDFAERANLKSVNKKTLESLAYAGAFDGFGFHRAHYFSEVDGTGTLIEKLTKYGATAQANKESAQSSLFGSLGGGMAVSLPKIPNCEPWTDLEKLRNEKEYVGFYVSGHPLDQYKLEIKNFCTCALDQIENHKNQEVKVAGIITRKNQRQNKNGNTFVTFTLEDYNSKLEMALFGQDFVNLGGYIQEGQFVYINGKVQPRYGTSEQYELKPVKIQLLSDVREKLIRNLQLVWDVQKISSERIRAMYQILKNHPGKCNLQLLIHDKTEKINVNTLSGNVKVSPSQALIDELMEFELDNYRVSS